MTAQPPEEIGCDADALAADMTTVDALARLQLGARRQGTEIRLKRVPADLWELLALCGLSDVIRADEKTEVPNSGPDPGLGRR